MEQIWSCWTVYHYLYHLDSCFDLHLFCDFRLPRQWRGVEVVGEVAAHQSYWNVEVVRLLGTLRWYSGCCCCCSCFATNAQLAGVTPILRKIPATEVRYHQTPFEKRQNRLRRYYQELLFAGPIIRLLTTKRMLRSEREEERKLKESTSWCCWKVEGKWELVERNLTCDVGPEILASVPLLVLLSQQLLLLFG